MSDNLINCNKCKRIKNNFNELRKLYPNYHNKPVSGRGNIESELCILGLAPGLHGANKYGKTFTGDFCSQILHSSLLKNNLYDDKSRERFYITNVLKCLPPKNKPLNIELYTCQNYLKNEISAMHNLKTILVFGKVAHLSLMRIFRKKLTDYPFIHGREYLIDKVKIINSYHCSQINIHTKRLTTRMLDAVIKKSLVNIHVD